MRASPLSLAHPTDLKHVTEVRLPASWSLKPDTVRIEDPAFEFQRDETWMPAVVGVLAVLGCGVLAWRVNLWDPQPWEALSQTYPAAPRGLGGWLLLVALGVAFSIYRLTHDLLGTLPSYTTGTWLAVATEGGSSYREARRCCSGWWTAWWHGSPAMACLSCCS